MKTLRIYLLLFLLTAGLMSPAAADTNDIERLAGRRITNLGFTSDLNLNYEDLITAVALRPGDQFQPAKLKESIDRLYDRKVFDKVDAKVTEDGGGVAVQFLLTPLITVADLQFEGNKAINERRLKRLSGIHPGSDLKNEDLARAQEKFTKDYEEEGYHQTTIKLELIERIVPSQVIAFFKIDEGYESKISSIKIDGEIPADVKKQVDAVVKDTLNASASEARIKLLRQNLLRILRKEGYLQASVQVTENSYQPLTGDVELGLTVSSRDPLSMVFSGNTVFSPEELLAPLKIETRTVPFTPNAINTLMREIAKLYQTRGYLFATATYTLLPGQEKRQVYLVKIEEGPKTYIDKIRFGGNRALKRSKLLEVMQTKQAGFLLVRHWKPGVLVKDQLAEDLIAIEDLYDSHGYFGTTATAELKFSDKLSKVNVLIKIDEHEQRLVSAVELVWKNLASHEALTASEQPELLATHPEIKSGDPFETEAIEAEQRRLNDVVIAEGYPNAAVELEADADQGTVKFVVNSGERVRVGQVMVQGNVFTHDFVIRREVELKSDDLWLPEKIQESQRNLYRLGLFRAVTFEPADGSLDEPVEDMAIRVSERDSGRLDLGVGFDTEDGLHLSSELGQRNLGGNGDTLLLGVDGFFKTGRTLFDAGNARVVFSRPRIFDTKLTSLNEGFIQASRQTVDQFSYDRIGIASSLLYPIDEELWAKFGVTVFQENIFDQETDVIIDSIDDGTTLYSMLQGEIRYDRRDQSLNPRKGTFSSLQAGLASSALGSEADFWTLGFQQSFYTPISNTLIWANNFRATYLRPYGDTDVIPLSQRVFLGGRHSLRGFSKASVGPRGDGGHVLGGDEALVFNTELQYDLSEHLVGVVFMDAGQAILKNVGQFTGDPLSFSDLRFSPGLGMRYKTPIGPLGVDLGFPLERENGDKFMRFNLGIGGSF